MSKSGISDLMLERYKLGELSREEKMFVESKFKTGAELQDRIAELKRSDFEFLNSFPASTILNQSNEKKRTGLSFKIVTGVCAALIVAGISFPLAWRASDNGGDRAKGMLPVNQQIKTELSIYLKTGQASEVYAGLPLHEGSTIQLAYTAPENRYGIIFSIDGRSQVTLHYPYSIEGTTRLTPGKQTALDEAYVLDDAPAYELFFFVVAKTPLNVKSIIADAETLADSTPEAVQNIIDESKQLFGNYEVKTVYLKKE